MNTARIALAAIGAFVAYFVVGGLLAGLPSFRQEFMKYPTVYRPLESMKAVIPVGMFSMLVAMIVLSILYAKMYRGGSGFAQGAVFGALIGVFAICAFVLHNYVNLNIGGKLAVEQAVIYFAEWLIVGIVIGLIYRPVHSRA
jgi:hypothetical protein